jgi:hypothetical protein
MFHAGDRHLQLQQRSAKKDVAAHLVEQLLRPIRTGSSRRLPSAGSHLRRFDPALHG